MISMRLKGVAFGVVAFCLAVAPVNAFKLKTVPTPTEAKVSDLASIWTLRRFLDHSTRIAVDRFLKETIHEAITHRIWGCEDFADGDLCFNANHAPLDFLVGVRWNDNPPFQVSDTSSAKCRNITIKIPALRSDCWLTIFRDGQKGATQKGEFYDGARKSALLLRSHFGDMQFLHSMANQDGEPASKTRDRILAWAEFSYRVAIGDIPRDVFIYTLSIGDFPSMFSKQTGWTPALLFGMGDPVYQRAPGLNRVAFGSLLHMIQDSFARGHALRRPTSGETCILSPNLTVDAPGMIAEFRSYAHQVEEDHAEQDSQAALKEHLLTNTPNVVDVGKMLKTMFEQKRPWAEVKPYVECIYRLENADAPSTSDV